jgi:aldose 1-epimerase
MIKKIAVAGILLAVLLISCQSQDKAVQKMEKKMFGKLADGSEVDIYTLTNKSGVKVKIINYGAAVVSLSVPDKSGKFSDVVLGYDSIEGYENDKSYFGAIVGRYGNRIAKGRFKLDGTEYQLTINDGENHLHGGLHGFNKVLWTVTDATESDSGAKISLSYLSGDGEEGYPGDLKLTVEYSLNNDNELTINYTGSTDKPTILNPTHHSYFNLTGEPDSTILGHELMIDADYTTPVGPGLIPTGKPGDVTGTPMDFRKPVQIGARIDSLYEQLKLGLGYDHNWILNKHQEKMPKVVTVYEPVSGRVMEVFTDQPGMQFYSGNFLDGSVKGKNGVFYKHRTGFCLEAQHYPDSPNNPEFPGVRLDPGQTYRQTTTYRFSVR